MLDGFGVIVLARVRVWVGVGVKVKVGVDVMVAVRVGVAVGVGVGKGLLPQPTMPSRMGMTSNIFRIFFQIRGMFISVFQ